MRWSLRLKIALGTGHALAYLHYDCNPCIIHRDIKPMNVLLGAEMEPRISDSRIAGIRDQCFLPAEYDGVFGTFRYVSPESAFSPRRSRESDVVSYGVVLLELITRKRPLGPFFPESDELGDLHAGRSPRRGRENRRSRYTGRGFRFRRNR